MANLCLFIFLVLGSGISTGTLLKNKDLDTVRIRYYIRNGTHMDVRLNEAASLAPLFNSNEPVAFYMHGLSETVEGDSVVPITDALLNYTNVNVIALDYRKIAGYIYPLAVSSIKSVGKAVAEAIENIIKAGVDRKSFHIIGHSLGAQVAGYVGRYVKKKLPRITGLDPAGPLFNIKFPHLSSYDAEFVDIIHTDAGAYGIALATGSVDFFPNYGTRPQPGCPLFGGFLTQEDFCSHHRSWWFYIESIMNRNAFVAVKCPNSLTYKTRICNGKEKVIMGYGTPTSAKGTFYLVTNSASPYGLGVQGATYDSTKFRNSISNLISSLTA